MFGSIAHHDRACLLLPAKLLPFYAKPMTAFLDGHRSAYDLHERRFDVGERHGSVAGHGETLRRAAPRLRVDLPRLAML
jgi:hypothetical protein